MDEQYNQVKSDESGRKDTSFASEAMEEEVNPTKDTKMIT
jgi:hypothetical protein